MILISSVSGALIFGLFFAEQSSTMENTIIEHNVALAHVASRSIESGYFAQMWPFETLKEISEFEGVLFWWIVKPNGEIVLADDAEMWGKQIKDDSVGINEMVIKDAAFYKTGEHLKLIVHPLNIEEGGKRWTFYLGASLKPIADARNVMIMTGAGYFLAVIIIASVLSAFVTKSVTRPIMELTEGVKAIAQGNLNYTLKLKSRDEIGRLAMAFNKMTNDLKRSRAELENYSKTLEKKVEERTVELNEKMKRLQKSETATLNIMEDLQHTIDKLKETQTTIELQNIQLKKLDRIKSDFLNITSHELRTPMSAIKGYIQMIMKRSLGEITEEQKQALNVIVRNTNRLDNLIQDILDISRLESGTMKFISEPTNIQQMVNEAIETTHLLAETKMIQLHAEVEENLSSIVIDKERIKQVIMNLINNAIKFSPNGSTVTLRVTKEIDNILIEVNDHGRGIPKEHQAKIFDTFYQVDSGMDRKFGGAGLGLSLAKGIVLSHGGNIWVESSGTPGEGSTFKFTIPLVPVQDPEGKFREIDIFRLKDTKKTIENDLRNKTVIWDEETKEKGEQS